MLSRSHDVNSFYIKKTEAKPVGETYLGSL